MSKLGAVPQCFQIKTFFILFSRCNAQYENCSRPFSVVFKKPRSIKGFIDFLKNMEIIPTNKKWNILVFAQDFSYTKHRNLKKIIKVKMNSLN